MARRPPGSSLFPYPALFRSRGCAAAGAGGILPDTAGRTGFWLAAVTRVGMAARVDRAAPKPRKRSEEQTSELQSRPHPVGRLLLEKKKAALTTSTNRSEPST